MKTYYLDGLQSRRITKQTRCCAETASSHERVLFCIEIFRFLKDTNLSDLLWIRNEVKYCLAMSISLQYIQTMS